MHKLVLANFKSNKSSSDTIEWFERFLNVVESDVLEKIDISIAPSFISIAMVKEMIDKSGKKITLSIQDISSYSSGSYTGAISGQNLNELKINYAIVGHSERRKYFRETPNDVALKVVQCLENNITPVLCVDTDYLDEQLGLLGEKELEKCVYAYEPISAIGTGQNADVGSVKEVIEKIKRLAGDVRVIYGGSVDEFNINEYLLVADGVLPSTSSLNVDQFFKVIDSVI